MELIPHGNQRCFDLSGGDRNISLVKIPSPTVHMPMVVLKLPLRHNPSEDQLDKQNSTANLDKIR